MQRSPHISSIWLACSSSWVTAAAQLGGRLRDGRRHRVRQPGEESSKGVALGQRVCGAQRHARLRGRARDAVHRAGRQRRRALATLVGAAATAQGGPQAPLQRRRICHASTRVVASPACCWPLCARDGARLLPQHTRITHALSKLCAGTPPTVTPCMAIRTATVHSIDTYKHDRPCMAGLCGPELGG